MAVESVTAEYHIGPKWPSHCGRRLIFMQDMVGIGENPTLPVSPRFPPKGESRRSRGTQCPGFASRPEGAGNAGCFGPHPWPRVRKEKVHELQSPQVRPCHRHSLRDGFTTYSALSPAIGL